MILFPHPRPQRSLKMTTHEADGNSLSPSHVDSPEAAAMQEKAHKGSSSSGSKVSSLEIKLTCFVVLGDSSLFCFDDFFNVVSAQQSRSFNLHFCALE